MPDRILAENRYLRCIERDGWTFVERPDVRGIVTIVPVTDDRRLLLVQQYRPPVRCDTLELPAGLAGDDPQHADEPLVEAARRELREETGYDARRIELLVEAPSSPGVTSELVSFFLATQLERVDAGGGVDGEKITVHEVPLSDVAGWLRERQREGLHVSAKVYAGLYFAWQTLGPF